MAMPEIRQGNDHIDIHIIGRDLTPENSTKIHTKKAQLPQVLFDYIKSIPEYSLEDVSTDRGKRYKITILQDPPQMLQYAKSNSRKDIAQAMLSFTVADFVTLSEDIPKEAAIGMKAILLMQEAGLIEKVTYTPESIFEEIIAANGEKYADD